MSLLVRRPQELYRVYDELEYMSGTPGVECLAAETVAREASRRRGGVAAAMAALLVVGGGLLTLLAIQKLRVLGVKQVAPARRLQASAPARHRAPIAGAHMRRDRARSRRIKGMQSVQRRKSPGHDRHNLPASRQVVAAVIHERSRTQETVSEVRRPEFGFER
jgi:hypothetical protein